MPKYAFFLDIDGTYLSSEGKIIEENVMAVNELIKKGHYVFLCSGRTYYNISEYIINSANFSGIIAALGAIISIDGKLVRHAYVSHDYAKRVAAAFLKTDRWLLMGSYEQSIGCNMDRKDKTWIDITSVEELDNNKKKISTLDMDADMPDELISLINEEMTIYYYDGGKYAQAGVKGVTKANAIEYVINLIGVKQEHTIAIGDSSNDIEMLEYANLGVAMKNADDDVKKHADFVTDTNDNAGVAQIFNKYL